MASSSPLSSPISCNDGEALEHFLDRIEDHATWAFDLSEESIRSLEAAKSGTTAEDVQRLELWSCQRLDRARAAGRLMLLTGMATEVIFWPATSSLAARPSSLATPATAQPTYDLYEAKGVVFPTLMKYTETLAYQELEKLGEIYPDVISAYSSRDSIAYEAWVYKSDKDSVGLHLPFLWITELAEVSRCPVVVQIQPRSERPERPVSTGSIISDHDQDHHQDHDHDQGSVSTSGPPQGSTSDEARRQSPSKVTAGGEEADDRGGRDETVYQRSTTTIEPTTRALGTASRPVNTSQAEKEIVLEHALHYKLPSLYDREVHVGATFELRASAEHEILAVAVGSRCLRKNCVRNELLQTDRYHEVQKPTTTGWSIGGTLTALFRACLAFGGALTGQSSNTNARQEKIPRAYSFVERRRMNDVNTYSVESIDCQAASQHRNIDWDWKVVRGNPLKPVIWTSAVQLHVLQKASKTSKTSKKFGYVLLSEIKVQDLFDPDQPTRSTPCGSDGTIHVINGWKRLKPTLSKGAILPMVTWTDTQPVRPGFQAQQPGSTFYSRMRQVEEVEYE